MADLIVIVFWHAHALDIPFPIGYNRREHLGELERAELRLDYAHVHYMRIAFRRQENHNTG